MFEDFVQTYEDAVQMYYDFKQMYYVLKQKLGVRLSFLSLFLSYYISLCPMIKWSLPVELPTAPSPMQCGEAVMLIGSCFAERIGKHFAESKCPTVTNPWGVLYNPASIARALSLCLIDETAELDKLLNDSLFCTTSGVWTSWLTDTSLSAATKEAAYAYVLNVYHTARKGLKEAQWLFITLGTNYAYYHQDGSVVANCHKQPQSQFRTEKLSVRAIVEEWSALLNAFQQRFPHFKVVFTVSPYRYTKYGLHENTLSKSVLFLAIDELLNKHKNTYYFPAYEIVIDELRDYRFYKEDLCHPSTQASDYVWERLKAWCFAAPLLAQSEAAKQLQRDLAHRPRRAKGKEYRQFIGHIEKRIQAFAKAYPFASMKEEMEELAKRKTTIDNDTDDELR